MPQSRLELTRKLVLGQNTDMLLRCIAMPIPALSSLAQEIANSNPFLDVEPAPLSYDKFAYDGTAAVAFRERSFFDVHRDDSEDGDAMQNVAQEPVTFTEYVLRQLGELRLLDEYTRGLCEFIVGCFNTDGYLDCSLEELADIVSAPLFDVEQALYIVQSLEPAGVGARSLAECLLLQLSRGADFNETTVHLVCYGLQTLAKKDYKGLADILHTSVADARQAGAIVSALEPIPSRGFYAGAHDKDNYYIVPEATITRSGSTLTVTLNDSCYPKVSLHREYCDMIGDSRYTQEQEYLRKNCSDAKAVVSIFSNRRETIKNVLEALVKLQHDFFLEDRPLKPLTMAQLAAQIGVNTSTVSRAAKDKHILFNGKMYPIKDFFSTAIDVSPGRAVSADAVKRALKKLIAAEKQASPLSDQALSEALSALGMPVSRRSVAKYRGQLGIEIASARKK